jgi:hypothetical protein
VLLIQHWHPAPNKKRNDGQLLPTLNIAVPAALAYLTLTTRSRNPHHKKPATMASMPSSDRIIYNDRYHSSASQEEED